MPALRFAWHDDTLLHQSSKPNRVACIGQKWYPKQVTAQSPTPGQIEARALIQRMLERNSQHEVARKLGLSQPSIHRLASGASAADYGTISALARLHPGRAYALLGIPDAAPPATSNTVAATIDTAAAAWMAGHPGVTAEEALKLAELASVVAPDGESDLRWWLGAMQRTVEAQGALEALRARLAKR